MQVSVESTNSLERRLTIILAEDRISNAVDSRLKDLSRRVKIKGFRPGKVPMRVIQRQYGKQVRSEVVNDLVQSSFYEAIDQEKLRPAGAPQIDSKRAMTGDGLEYTAIFEVYPEIKPADVSGIKIEKPTTEITETDIDTMIESIREQHKIWQPVERSAQEGDQLSIDFSGSINGEPFEGNSASGMKLELGTAQMIPGFEEGLIGAEAGEEKSLEVTFPENYHVSSLAGQPAKFDVRVNAVAEGKLPEVDEQFVLKLGIKEGDVVQMRDELRGSMQRDLDTTLESRLKYNVMEKLLEINKFDIPKALITGESQVLMEQMVKNLQAKGMRHEDIKLDPSMFTQQAERRVSLGLILSEIVKIQGFKAESSQLKTRVEEIAKSYEHPEEIIKWYYGDQQRLAEIESAILEKQVVEWALEQAEITENNCTFSELMASDQQQKKS